MGWRLARSLEQLRSEINVLAPGRSTASDGTIGDPAHASRPSDHNPNADGVVCAADFTHDPAHGADMVRLSEHIRRTRHRALKYVIFNRRIASASSAWRWEGYDGPNPHTKHMHVSVGRGYDGHSTGPYDDTSGWGISSTSSNGGDDDMIGIKKGDSGEEVRALQRLVGYAGHKVTVDGQYGPATATALAAARKDVGSEEPNGGDKLDGTAFAQLVRAVARAEAKEHGGKEGPKGDPGPRAGGLYELRPVDQ